MSIEYRFADTADYPRIRAFLDEFWAQDHIYVRRQDLFDWTFRRPGFWPEGGYSFSLAEDGGALVGILGGILYDLNFHGSRRRAVWIVNFAVRPDYRRGPAALRLLSTFRNPSYPVVIASGLNPATVAIYQVLRGQVLQEAPRHVAVLPEAVDRAAHLIRAAHPGASPFDALALAQECVWPDLPASEGPLGDTLPATWDEADWPRFAAATVGACRDLDYLTWRYRNHPCFDYRVIAAPEGRTTGLLVWRLETATRLQDGVREPFDRIGRVVEFLPSGNGNAARLLAALQAQLRAAGAIGADFYSYHGASRRSLCLHGFRQAPAPAGLSIPTRLQPIDAGGGTLNAMFAGPDLPPCDAAPDCAWYWTRSDSDQDRPN